MSVAATGLSYIAFRDVAGSPGAAGRLGRNVVDLEFHDGTAARKTAFLETTQTFSGAKTFSAAATFSGVATFSAAPVIAVEDARTNTVATFLTVRGTTTGTPAAGIGSSILMQAESGDEAPSDFGRLDFVATDVTAASEDTVLDVALRVAGAALTAVYRFVATGAFRAIFTHANTADRTYTLPDVTDTVVLLGATQTLTAKTLTAPVLGGSTTVAAGGTIVPAAVSGTPAQHGLFQENVVKVWAKITVTPGLDDSFNMTSVADAGTGLVTITFDRDFVNATYSPVGSDLESNANIIGFDTFGVGSVRAETFTHAGAAVDTAMSLIICGDQ